MKSIIILLFALLALRAYCADGVEIRAFYVSRTGAVEALKGNDISGALLSSGPDAFIAIQAKNHTDRPASGVIAVHVLPEADPILVPVPRVAAGGKGWVTTIIPIGDIIIPNGKRSPELKWERFEQE